MLRTRTSGSLTSTSKWPGPALRISLWWFGGTRSAPWSHRCRSWSRGWWGSGRCIAQCYCVPATAGFCALPCASPSSTGWWCARLEAARNPPCGWTLLASCASDGRSARPLWTTHRSNIPVRTTASPQIKGLQQSLRTFELSNWDCFFIPLFRLLVFATLILERCAEIQFYSIQFYAKCQFTTEQVKTL